MQQTFPDISAILAAKEERRRALAALSWEEKVAIIEQMQALLPGGLWRDQAAAAALASERNGRDDMTGSDPGHGPCR